MKKRRNFIVLIRKGKRKHVKRLMMKKRRKLKVLIRKGRKNHVKAIAEKDQKHLIMYKKGV